MVSGTVEIITKTHEFHTGGEVDIIDLTSKVSEFVSKTGLTDGRVTVFVNGSTGAVATTEFEPRLTRDNKNMIDTLIPKGQGYYHDQIDSNAHSHLRATLLGCEVTIPVSNSRLLLGTWQQIVFFELDVRKRRRTVIFQMIGV